MTPEKISSTKVLWQGEGNGYMSTSPEAKQAAVWAGWPHGSDGHRPFCEGYNAATAKLKERLAQMEQWLADVGYSAEEIDKALLDYSWVKPK